MKTIIKQATLIKTIGVLLFCAAMNAPAQLAILHSFSGSDGGSANQHMQMILSGSMLYGTTSGGGSNYEGTVFKVNTNGTGFTTLHNFTATHFSTLLNDYTNDDGATPEAGLVLSGNTLYGTTEEGGHGSGGGLFKVNIDGTGFTNFYNFTATSGEDGTNADGAVPTTGLVLSGSTLYGMTVEGGEFGSGTIFKVNTNGTGFAVIYPGGSFQGNLVLSGNTLYGSDNDGIFKIMTNGTSYTIIHTFSVITYNYNPSKRNWTNSDGLSSYGTLLLSSNTLYGTAASGGNFGWGTIFSMNTNGANFSTLHSFTGADGNDSEAGLVLSGSTLYGTTYAGGSVNDGVVFLINTNGSGFTNLFSFTGNTNGSQPGVLLLSSNILYGTTELGGSNSCGIVFALPVTTTPIPLVVQVSSSKLILNWSDPAFSLQAAPALTSPYTNIPNATSPYTNPTTGSQKFFRLIAN